jgi:hypothetical protein
MMPLHRSKYIYNSYINKRPFKKGTGYVTGKKNKKKSKFSKKIGVWINQIKSLFHKYIL